MKMPADLFATLKAACEPWNTEENRERYRNRQFARAELTKDVNKRFRWDIFSASRVDCRPFYDAGLHDAHIDTALRAIIPPL